MGRDAVTRAQRADVQHFNPRAPYGARPFAPPMVTPSYSLFQSTRPVWGATCCKRVSQIYDNNFNPRAPYGARQEAGYTQARIRAISIHAPHMGRDVRGCYTSGKDFYFNPRAPCGARLICRDARRARAEFQSTRPMRGATSWHMEAYFARTISIHAPHAGRDRLALSSSMPSK